MAGVAVPDLIAALALQALDDPDALPVLGDAVLDAGWVEPWPLAKRRPHAGKPSRHWALRIVAYAIFGEWPKRHDVIAAWPVVSRCLVEPYGTTLASQLERISLLMDAGFLTPEQGLELLESPWQGRASFYGELVMEAPGSNWRLTL